MSDQNNYPDPSKVPPELQQVWQAGYDEWMKREAFERGVRAAEAEIQRKDEEAAAAKWMEEQRKQEEARRRYEEEHKDEIEAAKRRQKQQDFWQNIFEGILVVIYLGAPILAIIGIILSLVACAGLL